MLEYKKMKKMCSFYVSDTHLGIMILPYLSEKIKQKNNIYTLLEKDMKEEINKILSHLQLEDVSRSAIEKISWSKNENIKYSDFEAKIEEKMKSEESMIFLIAGSEEYIKKENKKIEHFYEKKEEEIKNVMIINCYEVMQFNEDIEQILQEHDGIINTAGEKKIEEVFEGFQRKDKKLAQ